MDDVCKVSDKIRKILLNKIKIRKVFLESEDAIAVVGCACRFPGDANDPESFWEIIRDSRVVVTDPPKNHFLSNYSKEVDAISSPIFRAGYLENIDTFATSFFKISPREAECLDPQQKLLLEISWLLLEDAGYIPSKLSGRSIGVFVGACSFDFSKIIAESVKNLDKYSALGLYSTLLANRISYFYNFKGPSMVIDTACSSSLVALHEAIKSIKNKECEQAIVGGVNLILSPVNTIALDKVGILSKDGYCRTFDDDANGYVRGEGVGLILIKLLSKAIQDNNKIYGIIRSTHINHNGYSNTIAAPNMIAQRELLSETYRRASINPLSVTYIETHGTATKIGDTIEVEAIESTFENSYPYKHSCYLGSVKPNIGHLEGVAGIAGLIKILMMFKHKKIPAQANFHKLNRKIQLKSGYYAIAVESRDWLKITYEEQQLPLRAAISSFGFGGVNAHAILEEYSQNLDIEELISKRKNVKRKDENAISQIKCMVMEWEESKLKSETFLYAKKVLLVLPKHFLKQADFFKNYIVRQNSFYVILLGDGFNVVDSHLIEVDWNSEDGLSKVLQKFSIDTIDEIYYIGEVLTANLDIEDAIEKTLIPLLFLLRVINKRSTIGNELLVKIITTNLFRVLHSDRLLPPVSSVLVGFSKVIQKEFSYIKTLCFDVDYYEFYYNKYFLVENLINDSGNDYPEHLIAYREGKRYQYLYHEVNLLKDGINRQSFFRENSTFIVVGGAGGIGRIICYLLAKKYRVNLIIVGKNRCNDYISSLIKDIDQVGCRCEYHAVDVNNLQRLKNFSQNIIQRYPKIDGIIFSATDVENELIFQINRDKFLAGLKTKTLGAKNVFDTFFDKAEQIIYFSSIAGMFGIEGGASYSAANSFLDVYANYLYYNCNFVAKAIDWGLWTDVGLAKRFNSHIINSVQGITSFTASDGLKGFESIVNSPWIVSTFISANSSFFDTLLKRNPTKVEVDAKNFIQPLTEHLATCYEDEWRKNPSLRFNTIQKEATGFIKYLAGIEILNCSLLSDLAKKDIFKVFEELNYYTMLLLVNFLQTDHQFFSLRRNINRMEFIQDLKAGDKYQRFLSAILKILERYHLVKIAEERLSFVTLSDELKNDIQHLNEIATNLKKKHSQYSCFIDLINRCFMYLQEVLSGGKHYANVLFLNGQVDYLERLYAHNEIFDFYNIAISLCLREFLEYNLKFADQKTFDILEIGAGVGGTTFHIIPILDSLKIKYKYVYSDIAISFLNRAQKKYANNRNVDYIKLNIEDTPNLSKKFDIVIAANVLHATRNIIDTINNIKLLLKNDGVLLLSEVTSLFDYFTLTFGLTDGWWIYNDQHRIDHSPLISSTVWCEILKEAGFAVHEIVHPLQKQKPGAQTIFIGLKSWSISSNPHQNFFEELKCQQPMNFDNQLQYKIKSNDARNDVVNKIKKIIVEKLKLKSESDIDEELYFQEYGIDSIINMEIVNEVNCQFSLSLPATILFEYPSLSKLSKYIVETFPQTKSFGLDEPKIIQPFFCEEDDGIAIIGVAGIYPESKTLDELWINVLNAKNLSRPIPKDRNWENIHPSFNSNFGCFIENYNYFNPYFFNIPPSDAELLDSQEKLFLQVAWNAFEDAGYSKTFLANEYVKNALSVGVYVGVTSTSHLFFAHDAYKNGDIKDESYSIAAFSSIANRFSYWMDLHGPSIAIDTMCSSALTALHLACQAIRLRECDMALVGGVNLYQHPVRYSGLSKIGMLSRQGKTKSFGSDPDGFVPGEGVGAILIKSLSKARTDRDHIYGIIKATAINHGGKTGGYTVPNLKAQEELICTCIDKAKINPRTINYVEAHGTGTILGDPIEFMALTKAFQKYTDDMQFCFIGSIKSNIGHLEAAAAIAGITKVLLQFKHSIIVPALYADDPNPKIDFKNSPFILPNTLIHWNENLLQKDSFGMMHPRRAIISSFGAGGSNAHVIIEEPPQDVFIDKKVDGRNPVYILLFSATDYETLIKYLHIFYDFIISDAAIHLKIRDIAYTLMVGREHFKQRKAFIVFSKEGFIGQLKNLFSNCATKLSENNIFIDDNVDFEQLSNLNSKLQKWLDGEKISWESLYELNANVRRVSLPSYPYELIKCGINISPSKSDKWCLDFYVKANDDCIQGHTVQGDLVVPASFYVGLIYMALEKTSLKKHGHHELKNITWLKACKVQSESIRFAIEIYKEQSKLYKLAIKVKECEGFVDIVHAEIITKIDYEVTSACFEVNQIFGNNRDIVFSDEFYKFYNNVNYTYNLGFKTVLRFTSNGRYSYAEICFPLDFKLASPLTKLTLLLDGVFQAAAFQLIRNSKCYVYYPYLLEKFFIYSAELPTIVVVKIVDQKKSFEKNTYDFYIDVLSQTGELVARLSKFTIVRKSRSESLKIDKENRMEPEILLFQRKWIKAQSMLSRGDEHNKKVVYVRNENNSYKNFEHIIRRSNNIVIVEAHDIATLREKITELKDSREIVLIYPLNIISDSAEINTAIDMIIMSIFALASSLLHFKLNVKINILCPFVLTTIQAEHLPYYVSLESFFKVLNNENSNFQGKIIQIDKLDDLKLNDIIGDYYSTINCNYIKYQESHCYFQAIEKYQYDFKDKRAFSLFLKKEYGYIVVGGMSGIGFELCKKIVQSNEVKLIILGRSALDDVRQRKLDELNRHLAKVYYFACDISKKHDFIDVGSFIEKNSIDIKGIFNFAAFLHDSFLYNKQVEEFKSVLSPKIVGNILLDSFFADNQLDFFIVLSSLASVLGSVGQGDYCTANRFAEEFIMYRNELVRTRQRFGKSVAISLPIMSGGSLNADRAYFIHLHNKYGLDALSVAEFLNILPSLLRCGSKNLLLFFGSSPSLFLDAVSVELSMPVSDSKIRQFVSNKLSTAKKIIKNIIAMNLKILEKKLDDETPFEDYGIDSINIMQLNAGFEKKFGKVPKTLFFEYQNIKELARYIAENYLTDENTEFPIQNNNIEKILNRSENKFELCSLMPNFRDTLAKLFNMSHDKLWIEIDKYEHDQVDGLLMYFMEDMDREV